MPRIWKKYLKDVLCADFQARRIAARMASEQRFLCYIPVHQELHLMLWVVHQRKDTYRARRHPQHLLQRLWPRKG